MNFAGWTIYTNLARMNGFAGMQDYSAWKAVSPVLVLGVVAGGYLLGCVSTGYYLVRARTGKDIRQMGSGSTGARNVGRVLGSSGFAFTLAGDLAKGGVAVWLAMALTGSRQVGLAALLAVVVGHVWPAQLRFHGGKGVATSLAGLLMFDCWLALIYCVAFGLVFAICRRAVASSLVAYLLLPVGAYLCSKDALETLGISILAVIVLIAHHSNVMEAMNPLLTRRNLQAGPEPPVKEI
jgi:glycerol-3-phosphate acyltransferase PlsY